MRAWFVVTLLALGSGCGAGAQVRLGVAKIDCGAAERGLTFATDGLAPCTSLREDIDYATDAGAAFRLWPAGQTWDGWHLQAIAPDPLPQADIGGVDIFVIGITDLNEHEILITTGIGRAGFRSCLVHELLHTVRGAGHCHWSKLAPMFAVLGDVGAYYDECDNTDCGYRGPGVFTCIPRPPTPPTDPPTGDGG